MSARVERLVEFYAQAARNMASLPICNAALAVEAVGFREHAGREVGVVVTPWFMNLVVLPSPADAAAWRRGELARLAFPSGAYDFVVGEAAGEFVASCSLFTLMHDFADQVAAREAALAAAEALFEPAVPAEPERPKEPSVMSRRKFFGG